MVFFSFATTLIIINEIGIDCYEQNRNNLLKTDY